MTSDIQWEEDWFSVSCETVQNGDKGDKEDKEEREVESQVNQRIDWLERLIHHQSEIIRSYGEEMRLLLQEQAVFKQEMMRQKEEHAIEIKALKEEIHGMKGEIRSTSHTSMTELLEELKRVKERELNYALRRHQPVPFFDSGNLIRMVGSVGSVSSPLFRHSLTRQQVPSLKL
jgi:hypothetical protein